MVNRYLGNLVISLMDSSIIVFFIFSLPKITIQLPNVFIFRVITTFLKSTSPFPTLPSSYLPCPRDPIKFSILPLAVASAKTISLGPRFVDDWVTLSQRLWN